MIKNDYVYPQGNENEFFEMANRLGIEKLVFIYCDEKIARNQDNTNALIMVQTDKLSEKSKYPLIYRGLETRKALESPRINMVIGQEYDPKRDKLHERRSGVNHVLFGIAKEKDKMIAISFSDLLELEPKKRATVLGRCRQNLKLFKSRFIIGSFAKDPLQMRELKDIYSIYY